MEVQDQQDVFFIICLVCVIKHAFIQVHLGAFGYIWVHLGAVVYIRVLSDAIRCIQVHSSAFGCIQVHSGTSGAFGCIQVHSAAFGATLGLLIIGSHLKQFADSGMNLYSFRHKAPNIY